MTEKLIDIWQKIIIGDQKSWVLFKNGTVVIFSDAQANLREKAIEIMKEYGPVMAATSSGDFSVIDLIAAEGWTVTCHHPDILTYVSPEEMQLNSEDWIIGLFGRSKRNADALELEIIHIEDKGI